MVCRINPVTLFIITGMVVWAFVQIKRDTREIIATSAISAP